MAIACGEGERSFEAPVEVAGAEVSADTMNLGEFVYVQRCRRCHGLRGAGDGPYASSLRPPPADLSAGSYPRLAPRGGVPDRSELARVIRDGIDGTAMEPQELTREELDALVRYVLWLVPDNRGAPAR
ncbi:MAG: cytochrome c [Sandaracinaceae bacterium]